MNLTDFFWFFTEFPGIWHSCPERGGAGLGRRSGIAGKGVTIRGKWGKKRQSGHLFHIYYKSIEAYYRMMYNPM